MDTLKTNEELELVRSIITEIINQDERRRELAAMFISQMAEEANSLARVWKEVVDLLENAESVNIQDSDKLNAEIERHRWGQMPHYYKLREFYSYLADITKVSLSDKYADNIVMRISALLNEREITKALYDKAIKQMDTTVLVDERSRELDFSKLRDSVDALHKEAAAIEVLAYTIRSLPQSGQQRIRPTLQALLMLGFIILNNVVLILLLM
jgi:hypothetical protein